MALSTSVVQELRRELQRLEAERNKLGEQIDAIRRLIDDGPERPKFTFGGTVTETSLPAPKSVKATVLDVLLQHPGWKSGQVTSFLRERGFETGGDTKLSHRVYNEIWRMVQSGEVVRTPDGGFVARALAQ